MAVPLKLKKVPLDVWSVKEKLALACSVKRSGDQNWVSVSRAIKPFGDPNRPPDWFSQKNCAVQYAELLEQVETPKRKRGDKEKEAIETPGDQIVRKLMIEHIEELKHFVQEEQQRYKKLKREVELIRSGQWDDRLQDVWEEMQREKKEKEEKAREAERKAEEEAKARAQALALRRVQKLNRNQSASSLSEFDESTQDSISDQVNIETDDESLAPSTPTISSTLPENIPPIKIEIPPNVTPEVTKPMPPTSPLLSSLLQSKHKSVDDLQQIKAEAEAEHAAALQASQQAAAAASTATAAAATATAMTTTSASTIMAEVPSHDPEVPTSPALKSPMQPDSNDSAIDQSSTSVPLQSGLEPLSSSAGEESSASQADMGINTAEKAENEEPVEPKVKIEEETESEDPLGEVKKESPIKALLKHEEQSEDEVEMAVTPSASFVSVDDEVSIKEEPLSPSSSISSRLSETGGTSSSSRKNRKASRSRGGRRSNQKLTRKSVTEEDRKDDVSSRASDAETTDDERDELSMSANLGQGAFSESIPNSPLSHCSDTEDEKSYKAWKKSIMLVWRAAANHKYANVFLHPVTDDIAPGYGSIVHRPIDLSTVKKNIENGVIRTTQELQRDMMLMFTNAVMYNSSNHDVYKMAVEMYDDVMEHIEQYVSTQLMVQSSEVKLLRHIRRNESSDKEEETRRRRTSSEATEGGKAKKRKSRTEDT